MCDSTSSPGLSPVLQRWVHDNAIDLGLPPGRFTAGVSGDSAGTNFAACVTLRVRHDVELHEFATQHVVMTHAPKRCPDISRQAYEVIEKLVRAHSDAGLEARS